MTSTKSNRAGFTLIELVVVAAIIAILASIVLSALSTSRQRARDSKRAQSVYQLKNALQIYFSTNGSFPAGDETALSAALVPIYINGIPPDPSGGSATYQYQALSSPTTGGVCNSGNNCQSYHLGVTFEQGANSGAFLTDVDGENVVGRTNGTTVDGISTQPNCGSDGAATATTDRCYDVLP